MHNPKTVSMHFAKKDEMQNMWNYMTALRGNDDGSNGNEMFKRIITTTIRGDAQNVGAFSFNECNGQQDLRYYRANRADCISDFNKVLRRMHSHAVSHGEMGLKALAVYYERKRKEGVATLLRTMAYGLDDKDGATVLQAWDNLHKILS